jgi:hypothetical protein
VLIWVRVRCSSLVMHLESVLGTVVTVPVIVSEGLKTARNQPFLFDVPCCLAYAKVVGTTRRGQEG